MLGHALRRDGEASAGPEPSRQCPESQPNKVPMQVLTPAFWEHQGLGACLRPARQQALRGEELLLAFPS